MSEKVKLLAMLAALSGIALEKIPMDAIDYQRLIDVNDMCWLRSKEEISPSEFYLAIKQAEDITGLK